MPDVELVLDQVSRRFAGDRGRPPHVALDRVSFSVARGEVVAVIGPSGCGKSTTLRMVAGLDDPTDGTITIGGRSMRDVAPQERDVAMVFQGYALYPHMTARQIIEFPLRMRGVSTAERARAVDEAADTLGLTKLLDRRPDQLSGGERQRVAMGRAIVRKPKIFLFDEPLSNIDPVLREEIRADIAALLKRLGTTTLYVTHDHVEAMALADRIAVMNGGKLLQIATPREIYERPTVEFVGTFVGSPRMNAFGAVLENGSLRAGPFAWPGVSCETKGRVVLGVRPEHVEFADGGVRAEITAVEPQGPETLVSLDAQGVALRARRVGFSSLRAGEHVEIRIDARHLHAFDPARDGARAALSTPASDG